MAYDGILMSALTAELNDKISDSKIDKIHQPESDELIIQLRNKTGKFKLYISVNSNMPHISLVDEKRENPLKPPMFVMLLRKLLTGGVLKSVQQIGNERVINFSIESRNELGDPVFYTLIAEIMGKHSNIILIDSNTNIVIESIKRISFSQSRIRPIFPGVTYEVLTNSKINIGNFSEGIFYELAEKNQNTNLSKFLYGTIEGFSPSLSKFILNSANIDIALKVGDLTDGELKNLFNKIIDIKNQIEKKNFSPCTLREKTTGKYLDLLPFYSSIYENNPEYNIKKLDIISAINEYFQKKELVNRFLQKSQSLRKLVSTKIEKLINKLSNLENDLIMAEKAEEYKIKGELILANLYKIDPTSTEIEVENYYSQDNELLKISLDVRYSPSVNAQKLFKKYSKLKTAQIEVTNQIEEAQKEIAYLENVLTNLENTSDNQNIEEIKEELQNEGIIKKRKFEKKSKIKSQPNRYISRDGFEILSGKNNIQNDMLTLKTASKSDIWLHTKIIPGSHVIIKANGKEVPETTIYDAAIIAAYNSKGKNSSQVPVDYTLVKNVNKPSGAKPGMVIYVKNKTIYVTPTEEEVSILKKLAD